MKAEDKKPEESNPGPTLLVLAIGFILTVAVFSCVMMTAMGGPR